MTETVQDIRDVVLAHAKRAREAARLLAGLSTQAKNDALEAMASALVDRQQELMEANAQDIAAGRQSGMSEALIDRLTLTEKRVADMAEGLCQVAALPDPVGEVIEGWTRPNGLQIRKVRVPMGVIGIIYESRPNVTVDAAGLCLKAGNAVILRGGSEAIRSNLALVRVIGEAAVAAGVPAGAIELIETTDRAAARELMRMNEYVDVLIPRGGAGLIRNVVENSTCPAIETGEGVCHLYVDGAADLEMAERVTVNAKVQRPSVCNAIETLLVHRDVAHRFLPSVAKHLREDGVELRGCERTRAILPDVVPATEEDWSAEYLALILAVKVVDSVEDAVEHITRYGTRHSESIITDDYPSARRFIDAVDAACVYVNASTRFTDGFEFGLGAEIGISTQKLHARGPMGLRELTTYKYVIEGEGQIRT
jgi:glutamate-5-semialdehyde dehydrogenase